VAVSLFKVVVIVGSVATATWSSSARAEGSSLPYGLGGRIGWAGIIAQYNNSGELFRIEGNCRSSCTFLLAIKNVCVDPNATLYFHAAILHPNDPVDPAKNSRRANYYNSKLRTFVLANHYMDSWEFHPISGQDIIHKFGYRQCPAK
jgi:hypothetical protein